MKKLFSLLLCSLGMTLTTAVAQHTLTFYAEGLPGNVQQSSVAEGAAITAPVLPERTDNNGAYVLAGWHCDNSGTVFTDFSGVTMPDVDITFRAMWTQTQDEIICIDDDGDTSEMLPEWQLEGDGIFFDDHNTYYESEGDHNYEDDYANFRPFDEEKYIRDILTSKVGNYTFDSITYILHWKPGKRYNTYMRGFGTSYDGRKDLGTFYLNDGDSKIIGGQVYTLADEGENSKEIPLGTTLGCDSVVKFVIARALGTAYTLTWNADGIDLGDAHTSGDVVTGAAITAPANPTRAGYTFSGWYSSATGTVITDFSAVTMPAENLTFYATWTSNDIQTYTICVDSEGKTNEGAYDWYIDGFDSHNDTYENYNFPATKQTYTDTRKSYDGIRDSITYTLEISVSQMYKKYNRFIELANGSTSSELVDERVDIGIIYLNDDADSYTNANDRYHRTFTLANAGENSVWIDGGTKTFGCDSVVKFTIEQSPILTWNANNGKFADESTTITVRTKPTTVIVAPANPSREGYTFNGWNTEANGSGIDYEDTDVMPAAAQTYYAQWTAETYNIIYNELNGATNTNPASYTIESEEITFVNPGEREGYTFLKWQNAGGETVTGIPTGSKGDTVIIAVWQPVNYNIIYNNLNGATNTNPTSYTVESADINFVNPGTIAGYTFVEWQNLAGETVTGIPTGSMGDTVIVAIWQANDVLLYDTKTAAEYETMYNTYDGMRVNVILKWTIRANTWAAISLPFSVADIENHALSDKLDGNVYEFTNATVDNDNGIVLTFGPTNSIVAGKPYLIKPTENLTDLRFESVNDFGDYEETEITIDNAIEFRPTMEYSRLTRRTSLYITNNRLYYANQTSGTRIRAFKGYFEVLNSTFQYVQPRVRIAGVTSDIEITEGGEDADIEPENTLRKYMENGRLVIERNGIRYDATGARIP